MKKTIAIIIAFAVLATGLIAYVSAENEDAVFTISEVTGKPGETIKVILRLECDVEVDSIAFTSINFDETMLEFIGFTDYEHLERKTVMPIASFVDVKNRTIMAPFAVPEAYNGEFCTLEFKIKESSPIGESSVTATSVVKNGSDIVASSVVSGKVKVLPAVSTIDYKYGQSVQIGLIEPWFLKANARVYTATQTTNINYDSLADYGAYFIRASQLSNPSATQSTLTAEDIMNDPDAVKYSKKEGTATIDGSYITANYDKGIYTYELDDSVFVLFYIQDDDGISYAPIRERNLKSLLEERKDDIAKFPNELERNVYKAMLTMFETVKAYRDDYFANN